MKRAERTEDKLIAIRQNASILASGVQFSLGTELPLSFLQTIYIPFCSLFYYFDSELIARESSSCPPSTLADLLISLRGEECLGDLSIFSSELTIEDGSFSFTCQQRLNIYEKSVFALSGFSFARITSISHDTDYRVSHDLEARLILSEWISSSHASYPDIVNFLPLSLFESLKRVEVIPQSHSVSCHWLGQIYNENYLFYLASLKSVGTLIIGQPHGGVYCQHACPTSGELAEKSLSDIYLEPKWDYRKKIFPNWRASRNLFLGMRHFPRKKVNNKLLVLLDFIYIGPEPKRVSSQYLGASINDFTFKQLRELRNHFDQTLDFQLYPRQHQDVFEKINFLTELYPESNFILGGSAIENSRKYSGVIHISTVSTAIIELSAARVQQYVYLGPELKLRLDYESFLWDSKIKSTRPDYSNGAYILLDNSKYRSAYGASYFYPFYFASLIKNSLKSKFPQVL